MKTRIFQSKALYLALIASAFSCESLQQISPETALSLRSSKKGNNQKSVTLETQLSSQTPVSYQTLLNQSYGGDPRQTYDLYQPVFADSSSKKSVSVVMIHGGGWSMLDKSFLNHVVEDFKRQGLNITIFNINHRLARSSGTHFPQIMEDLNLFFKNHQSRKTELKLSDEVLLWGYSSGGHLALIYSYKYPKPYIKAVAAIAAPVDLTQPAIYNGLKDDHNRNLAELFIGTSYTQNPEAYKQASTLYSVSKQCIPTLLFYGGQDKIVDHETQGKALYSRLTAQGVLSDLTFFPDASHDMPGKMPAIIQECIAFWKSIPM